MLGEGTLEDVPTDETVLGLRELGIAFEPARLRELARDYGSAEDLARDHYLPQAGMLAPDQERLVVLAIRSLWTSFAADLPNVEMLVESIEEGHGHLWAGSPRRGVEAWERAWGLLEALVPSEVTSIEAVDDALQPELRDGLVGWCDDLEMELHNAGLHVPYALRYRAEFCRRAFERFPDSGEFFLHNMLSCEAEAYAMLGERERAEGLYRELVDVFPDNPWSYIHWCDLYWCMVGPGERTVDLDRAEELVRLGMERLGDDDEDLAMRMRDLEKEREKGESRE